ncbi:MAG: imidazolonepropionase [Pseudomonadota bacterium]
MTSDNLPQADLIIRNIGQLLPMDGGTGDASAQGMRTLENSALAVRDGKVAWIGRMSNLDGGVAVSDRTATIDAGGCVVTPGFIECHTHLVFASSREKEFQMRMEGKSYLEILEAGGGILSTVRATRKASEEELARDAMKRLSTLMRFGVTTCEIKSGYGLDTNTELKMLRVMAKLGASQPVRIVPTFLGAHAVPPEHRDKREKYIDLVIREMIPAVAEQNLARFCDVYLEKSAYSYGETERILLAAKEKGLVPRLHAGQFNDLDGARLGARLGAASIDHLEKVSDEGLAAMAEKGVTAVILPGAAFFVREKPSDAARMRRAGVRVAVSTDCNPGSSMTENLPLMLTMAVVSCGLGLKDAIEGATTSAAAALALPRPAGTLAVGAPADIVIHDVSDWRGIVYHFGTSHARTVIIGGHVVFNADSGDSGP